MHKQSCLTHTMFSLTLLFSFFIVFHTTGYAESTTDTVDISIPNVWALPGDTIVLPISISPVTEADQIWSLEGNIIFDDSIITAIEVSKDGTLTDFWTTSPSYNVIDNTLRIAFGGIYTVDGSGAVLTVSFAVSESSILGQTSPIQFDRFMLNEGDPATVTHDAVLTVGEASHIELSNTIFDFGSVEIDESAQRQLTITNQGEADLIIVDIYVDSEQYRFDPTSFPFTLPTSQNQEVDIIFEPSVEDTISAVIKITCNDPAQPIVIAQLTGIGFIGSTGVEDIQYLHSLPAEYKLLQNYPNPFNPSTDIRYQIVDSGSPVYTSLAVYNMLGERVRTLVDAFQSPGQYSVSWDAKDEYGMNVPSGIYLYSIKAGGFTQTKRMVYVR